LTYREHAKLIDKDFLEYTDNNLENHAPRIQYLEFNSIIKEDLKHTEMNDGNITIPENTKFPHSLLLPSLMHQYEDMHYKGKLVRPDETAPSRAYESQYQGELLKNTNFEIFRAFTLPSSEDNDSSMVNTLGSTMDSNTATSGGTIGSGIVYKKVFKNFQKSMELINQMPEMNSAGESSDTDYQRKTRIHNDLLPKHHMKGLYENELELLPKYVDVTRVPLSKIRLKGIITKLNQQIEKRKQEIKNKVNPEQIQQYLPQSDGESHVHKKLSLLGSILGLKIKIEKRMITNHGILRTDMRFTDNFDNLIALEEIEKEINKELGQKLIMVKAANKAFDQKVKDKNTKEELL
jgi:hypothetical protein